jgi:ankyrin repeat protein
VNGRTAIVRTLLQHGADPNAQDARGETALQRAMRAKKAEVVRLLMEFRR